MKAAVLSNTALPNACDLCVCAAGQWRLAHPSFVIECVRLGAVWASQHTCAAGKGEQEGYQASADTVHLACWPGTSLLQKEP
jgi:hypothetical protein